jgi:transcriptional regulator with XRE-family HTH domain
MENDGMDDGPQADYSDPELIAALDYHLRERGWRQAELSRRTGINASTISDWTNGRYEPGGEALRILCTAFGVKRSEFWSRGERIVAELREAAAEPDPRQALRRIESKLRVEILPEFQEALRELEGSPEDVAHGDEDVSPSQREEA